MSSVFFSLLILAGCDAIAPGDGALGKRIDIDSRAPGTVVVAEVDGRPITLAALRAALQDEGAEADVREVLDRLVTQEVLFGQAIKRPPTDLGEVHEVARARAIQRLVEDHFEQGSKAQDVPEELLKGTFERNKGHYNHPDLMEILHLLVAVDEAVAPDTPQRQDAQALAEAVRLEVVALERSMRSYTALKDIAATHKARGAAVRAEDLSWRARSSRLVPAFLDAAFELKADGDVSPVLATQFGYHVIVRRAWKDALKQTYAEVRGDVLERVHPDWRHQEFMTWMKRLSDDRALEVDATPLIRLQEALSSDPL